ncbi:MAG: CBM96 family carbohydrate-binding protein [Gaiellaceae bacterium]
MAALAAGLVAVQSGATTSHAAGGPTWWKVDLHEHSAFSGDARADIGVDAAKAKLQNYNAVFVTDHDRGSGFQIAGDNGNKISATEQLNTNWISKLLPSTLPSGSSGIQPSSVQSPSPVHSGTYSLHVKATAATSTPVRSMTYNPRGMGLRSGAITLDFWAYPVTTGATSGLDVSVSLGGDTTTGPTPFGYTTSDGVTHTTMTGAGKTTTIAWELGGARAAVSNGTSDVFANALSFTSNTWNHYVINVTTGQVQWTPQGGSTTTTSSTGLNGLPAADKPADYDVLTYVKMEGAATSGSAEGYFDDFKMSVASPTCTSTEFVYRNTLLPGLSGTNSAGGQFVMFPAREMGQNNHANQFNFGITSTSQYKDTFTDTTQDDNAICAPVNNPSAQWQFSKLGTDNVPFVQQSGYPVQDNHPGVTDTVSDVVTTLAHGADAVEARTGQDYSNPSDLPAGDAWDQILMKNKVIMGTQGSDAHEGPASTTPSMYIDAPSLTLNDLMHSYFEGRMYGAPGNFNGRVVFNLDGSSSPYPARYPVYVPSSQTSANVQLAISGGIATGQKVRWIYSNAGAAPNVTDLTTGSSYSAQRTIPLSGAFTYVRVAVVTTGAAAPTAVNTEPIFFESVSGMPAGMNARVDSITPPSGTCSCTKLITKGISATPTYSNSTLTLPLNDPVGSGVELVVQSPQIPLGVRVDGSQVAAASSLSAYQAGTGTSWFYDSGSSTLYIRDLQTTVSSTVAVDYSGGGGDTTPPSVPTNVNGSAVGSTEVDLTWTGSTDNAGGSGVAGYNVYRDGVQVNSSPVAATNYADTGLSASTQYSYTVSAVDNQGNESAQSSPPKQVTTGAGGGGGGGTFDASADAYVDSSVPSTNYGSSTKLRVDTSPIVNSYLRFPVTGVSGSVTAVTLKVYATSALAAGFEVHALANDTGGESSITSANAPAAGALLVTSPAAVANSYVTVTLPASAVSGNGDVNFVLVGRSTTALALSSRESANKPQLIVTSGGGGGGGGDTTPPSVPTNVNGTPVGSSEVDLTWTASTDNSGGSGVAGYNVFRDGTKVNSSLVTSTNYADTGLSASTQYGYTVSAVDNATNQSAQSSPPKQVTTGSGGGGGGGGGGTFDPIADSYVDASVPSTNFGTNQKLRVDTSPIVNSYLRFNVTGLSGSATTVTLKIYATSALAAGFEVHALADDTWGESTITSANAPAAGALLATSPAAVANSYVTVTLPASAVSGNGDVNFVLVGRSTTALALSSRESATRPQLVVA